MTNPTDFERPRWSPLVLPTDEQEFVFARGPERERRDPATGELVVTFRTAETSDVDAAVDLALASTSGPWGSSGAQRSRVLNRFAQALRRETERLAELITREQGKSIHEARIEVMSSADLAEYFAGLARTVAGTSNVVGPANHSVVLREPVGVVAVISPWNWPLLLTLRSMVPALAAGNACVVKPSSDTSAAVIAGLELLANDDELPTGVLACVPGGAVVGRHLVTHEGVDVVAFTGSTETGVEISNRVASQLRPLVLELGGKSAQLIFADADLDVAAAGVGSGIFTTTGQICTAGSRILVHESIQDDFLARFVDRAESLRIGDGLDPATQLGPLVSSAQQKIVLDYIALGSSEGTVLTGGGRPPGPQYDAGHFVQPTVISDLPGDSRLLTEEIFGPVLSVQTFATTEEAVALANRSEFGLAAGIWTTDLDRTWRVGRELRAGTVWVNMYQRFNHEAASSAYGRSGLGTTLGPASLEQFTRLKNLSFQTRDEAR